MKKILYYSGLVFALSMQAVYIAYAIKENRGDYIILIFLTSMVIGLILYNIKTNNNEK